MNLFYIIFIFSKKGGKQYKIKLLQRKTTETSLKAYSWNLPSKANVPNISFRIRRQFEIRKFVYFRLKLPLKMCHRHVGLYIQRNILVFDLGTIVMWKVHYHGFLIAKLAKTTNMYSTIHVHCIGEDVLGCKTCIWSWFWTVKYT